jgi:hypothetical protein
MWQQQDDNTLYNWYQANGIADATYNPGGTVNVCGNLSLGGYNDWRLPNITELSLITNYNNMNPAIDSTNFPGTNWASGTRYWSSTTLISVPTWAYSVSFGFSGSGVEPKSGSYYIRCVRSGIIASPSLINNGNGTITDSTTGLIWQQSEAGTMTWETALSYCENLTLASLSNWRLPNTNELQSIVDFSLSPISINTAFFPGATASWYSTSTTEVSNPTIFLGISFQGGTAGGVFKTDLTKVRCVH